MNKNSKSIEVPQIIKLHGHSNYYKKNLIFKEKQDSFYLYTLDLEIPTVSIHGDLHNPIGIDVDGGPLMFTGFKTNGLVLDHISNESHQPIILYFKQDELSEV